jgi:hypothetical protein
MLCRAASGCRPSAAATENSKWLRVEEEGGELEEKREGNWGRWADNGDNEVGGQQRQ